MTTLGTRLKIARIRAGLNQKESVKRLEKFGIKISQSYLSKIENDVNEPDIGQLKALSKIYQFDIVELIYNEEELKQLKR